MSEMVERGSKYTDDVRREAAVQYATTGSLTAISKAIDVPRTTLVGWKQTDWWDELVAEVRHEKADEHIAKYTALVSDAIEYAHANLDKASPKDALIMAATATDKARLLLNQPTSIRGESESIAKLQAQFEALSSRHRAIEDSVVDEQ